MKNAVLEVAATDEESEQVAFLRPSDEQRARSEQPKRSVRSGKGLKSAVGPRSAAPAPRLEQPFQILTSGDEQADHVDLGETAEAELAEAVPLLRFTE